MSWRAPLLRRGLRRELGGEVGRAVALGGRKGVPVGVPQSFPQQQAGNGVTTCNDILNLSQFENLKDRVKTKDRTPSRSPVAFGDFKVAGLGDFWDPVGEYLSN